MYVLVFGCYGTIYDGPFDTYEQAERIWWNYVYECGCGCGRLLEPHLTIATI